MTDSRVGQTIAAFAVFLSLTACGSDSSGTEATAAEAQEPTATAVVEPTAVPATPAPVEPAPVLETEAPEDPRFALEGEIGLDTSELNELVAFVEETAGREFLRPPRIVAQAKAEYEAGLGPDDAELAEFNDTIDADMRSLQAMGLTELGVADASAAWLGLMTSAEGVLGYYTSDDDAIYVPIASSVDDRFRSTVVHELVHALDAQYVDLIAVEERLDAAGQANNFDEAFALISIVEGRASSVQFRWDQINGVMPETELPEGMDQVPAAAILATALPYSLGLQYIEANGGPAQTWELYEDGPVTSEAILTGGLDGETVAVPMPDSDGPVLNNGPFGSVDIVLMLIGDSLEPSPLVVQSAVFAADGWAGGQSVVWGDDRESCVRIELRADTPEDLEEIETVFGFWAEEAPDIRTVEANSDRVLVTGCAPYLP